MARLAIRFDLRLPPISGVVPEEQYAAAIEQTVWADSLGFYCVMLSEHHGAPDGYLPSPIVLAAAMASRTHQIRLRLAAIVAPFNDPLRTAEDLAVLDLISRGRVDVTIGAGYVLSEFAMFGKSMTDRRSSVEECVAVLKAAWTGDPFEIRGRPSRILPRPSQRPRPRITLGGSSAGAARRAARIADDFFPSLPEQWEPYRIAMSELHGKDVGRSPWPGAEFVFISRDVESDWKAILPYALHEVNEYGRVAQESGAETGFRPVADAEELRATGIYHVLRPEQCVDMISRLSGSDVFVLHPLMGGLPPSLSWRSLELFESDVLPELRQRCLVKSEG